MGEVVNLNQYRKAKRLADKKQTAAENRAKFGRTKSDKQQAKSEAEQEEVLLLNHKLERELPEKTDDKE